MRNVRCKSIQAVNWAVRWTFRDPYILLHVEEHGFVQDGEEVTLKQIRAGINGVFKENSINLGLFDYLLEAFKEHP